MNFRNHFAVAVQTGTFETDELKEADLKVKEDEDCNFEEEDDTSLDVQDKSFHTHYLCTWCSVGQSSMEERPDGLRIDHASLLQQYPFDSWGRGYCVDDVQVCVLQMSGLFFNFSVNKWWSKSSEYSKIELSWSVLARTSKQCCFNWMIEERCIAWVLFLLKCKRKVSGTQHSWWNSLNSTFLHKRQLANYLTMGNVENSSWAVVSVLSLSNT